MFSGGAGRVHTKVRQEMRRLLDSTEQLPYLDEVARRFLEEGRKSYSDRGLAKTFLVDQGRELVLLTWLGDSANEAIAALLTRRGLVATPGGPGV